MVPPCEKTQLLIEDHCKTIAQHNEIILKYDDNLSIKANRSEFAQLMISLRDYVDKATYDQDSKRIQTKFET